MLGRVGDHFLARSELMISCVNGTAEGRLPALLGCPICTPAYCYFEFEEDVPMTLPLYNTQEPLNPGQVERS